MKKNLPKISNGARIFLISFLFLLLVPVFISAQGLVPCGTETYPPGTIVDGKDVSGQISNPCQFCHFFVMINNIIGFVMFTLVPVVAVLMLVVGGVMFFFAGAKPDMLIRAKGVITSTVIGLVIVFGAWVIVNTILTKSGIIDTPSILEWYKVDCSVR